jgi:predicted nuclease of predicted toxin-antitoxin system
VKFLADVNVSRYVVDRLRSKGFDVVRVVEVLDPRSSDDRILDEARRRSAIVISHDQDCR